MESGWLGDGCVQNARIMRATHLLHNTDSFCEDFSRVPPPEAIKKLQSEKKADSLSKI